MHTTKTEKVTFIHNGDYSGDVHIQTKKGEIVVPFEAIEELVANKLRMEIISKVEQADSSEIFSLFRY